MSLKLAVAEMVDLELLVNLDQVQVVGEMVKMHKIPNYLPDVAQELVAVAGQISVVILIPMVAMVAVVVWVIKMGVLALQAYLILEMVGEVGMVGTMTMTVEHSPVDKQGVVV